MTKSKSSDKSKSTDKNDKSKTQEKNKQQEQQNVGESKPKQTEPEIDWTPEAEVQLFYALRGHKPVGVAKHFHMICILDAFVNLTSKDVSSETIWKRLDTLYDMEALNENEDLKILKTDVDFTLEGNPDFEELMKKQKEQ